MRLSLPVLPLALLVSAALAAAGCGSSSTPTEAASTPPAAEAQAEAAAEDAAAAEEAAAIEQATLERQLAAQEADLALREREAELARRETELAAREAAAAKPAPRPAAVTKPAAAAKPAATAPTQAAAAAPPPPSPPVTVPAGTQLSVNLEDSYSTKTNAVGQPVSARLASDLVVGDRVVARAGAPISGSITEVTSGSAKIGAVPALKIDFTQLVVADGSTSAINARINQKGQSEKGRDTAKIVGGTAAGAIIGHQVDDDRGKVVGGLLGGAAGAVAAKKTGTEVEIPAGTVLAANLRSDFVYSGR